jgi:hypothetical protein
MTTISRAQELQIPVYQRDDSIKTMAADKASRCLNFVLGGEEVAGAEFGSVDCAFVKTN